MYFLYHSLSNQTTHISDVDLKNPEGRNGQLFAKKRAKNLNKKIKKTFKLNLHKKNFSK